MHSFQEFRLGEKVERLAVCQDEDSPFYSRLDDVQETFPGATRFKLGGITLNFLVDRSGKKYEPKRIAHYPHYTIDVICDTPGSVHCTHASHDLHVASVEISSPSAQPLTPKSIQLTVPNLSLRSPSLINAGAGASTPSPGDFRTVVLGRPMTVLSTIVAKISHLEQQLAQTTDQLALSTDQQSAHHQQFLEQFTQLQQELTEAKEQNERILADLAEVRKQNEETHRLQQLAIDKLTVAQQRIDAILIQNYELHEYPIPRLFVILPDPYERGDPRSLVAEKFRLYFLCECGEHCNADAGTTAASGQLTIATASGQLTIAAATPTTAMKNSVHLAKHEGYELSQPTEFMNHYGPYVLGMLRFLRCCLSVTTAVAPAVSLAMEGVNEVMDGVKSISERTVDAINFLEQKLDRVTSAEETIGGGADVQEEEEMFKGLAALEGADLRRLDAFLRNNDKDKILGNLYRIAIDTGHVKWVCLEHYRKVYSETAMESFLKCVKMNGGTYDEQLGKVTVSLTSAITAEDFFWRLSQQATAVTSLRVTLDWSLSSLDVVKVVEKVAQSNVQELNLGRPAHSASISMFSPSKYYALADLLFNPKIKGLTFTNIDLYGFPNSFEGTNHSPSVLQSLYFFGETYVSEQILANMITECRQLVDLRIGLIKVASREMPNVDEVIGLLPRLKTLHRYNLSKKPLSAANIKSNTAPYGSFALRELVDIGMPYPTGPTGLLEQAIHRSSPILEVLVLRSSSAKRSLDMVNILDIPSSSTDADHPLLARLTHLELFVDVTPASLDLLITLLPALALLHLGVNEHTGVLLPHVNVAVLKSLSLKGTNGGIFRPFYHAVLNSPSCQVESLMLSSVAWSQELSDFLSATPLKRLYLESLSSELLDKVLRQLNLIQLQYLTLCHCDYQWENEVPLAVRSHEFTAEFLLKLGYAKYDIKTDVLRRRARDEHGTLKRLPSGRVKIVFDHDFAEEYLALILPPPLQ